MVTKSVVEAQRAEIDGKKAIELKLVIKKADFWILLTPFDEVLDFRNKTEENLEYIPSPSSLFSQDELLLLKDDCVLVNMCNFVRSLGLVENLEEVPEVQMALFPTYINMVPRVTYTRKIKNKLAYDMHKVIRKKMNL